MEDIQPAGSKRCHLIWLALKSQITTSNKNLTASTPAPSNPQEISPQPAPELAKLVSHNNPNYINTD